MHRSIAHASAASMLVMLAACQSSQRAANTDNDEYSAGLAALRSGTDAPGLPKDRTPEDVLAAAGQPTAIDDLVRASQQAFADVLSRQQPESITITESAPPAAIAASSVDDDDFASAGLSSFAPESEAPALATNTSAASEVTSADLARQLASIISQQMIASTEPIIDALALLGLDSLAEGSLDSALEVSMLSPDEQRNLDAARSFIEAVRDAALGNEDAPVDAAERIALDLAESRPLRIVRAELCSRVDGYGQFTPFQPATFIAGRHNRAIVYVEVDRFRHTEVITSLGASTDPHFAVELTQRIEVFHHADQVLAMATPTLTDRRISRNRFRDYYVVTAIDLPQTLSVGQYDVKITMRDRSDNSLAQIVIPFTIVADASAVLADTPHNK